ncbi:MAG: hypothetical protein NTX61_13365 [Bacteroidetes bacterium]|nr:hypothetical protein [Bacteroidota bacterium]
MKKINCGYCLTSIQPVILFVCFVVIFPGCVANKYSSKVKGESMALRVKENSDLIRYATLKPQVIPDLASRTERNRGVIDFATIAVSEAIGGIINLVDKEKKKYSATYRHSIGQCYFYDQISESSPFDPSGMQFTGFTFLRLVKNKKGVTDTAVYARFSVDMKNAYEIINNSSFTLKLDDLKINYAKAKIMAKKWYEPWSWFMASKYPKLNMDFEIIFTSSFVTREGNIFDNVPVGKFYLILRNIPMGRNDPGYEPFYAQVKNNSVAGRSFLVPRSFGYYYSDVNHIKPSYGQGIYNIMVNVTESSRSNFVGKLLYDNTTGFIKEVGGAIQVKKLTK